MVEQPPARLPRRPAPRKARLGHRVIAHLNRRLIPSGWTAVRIFIHWAWCFTNCSPANCPANRCNRRLKKFRLTCGWLKWSCAPLVYAVNGADAVDPFLPVFFVVISIWLGIKCLRDWAQPIEKLSCLDEPSIDAPSATPPSETATASGKPWVSFCVTLTYLGTGLFGLPPTLFGWPRSLFHNHLLNQWSVGIFVELICLTSLLALLLNQLATPQAWRKWFKLAAWLGMVAWLLAIGSA